MLNVFGLIIESNHTGGLLMINYVNGDATKPIGDGNKIIAHICNDVGGWGSGFVVAVSRRWRAPETAYRSWFGSKKDFALGEIQLVQVDSETWVANMIAQHRVHFDENGNPPIRYSHLNDCLNKLAVHAKSLSASIHAPRMGCGLAGGSWDRVEPLIVHNLVNQEIPVTIYDFGE